MALQTIGKLIDDPPKNVRLVVLNFGVSGKFQQPLQTRLEGVMLVEIRLQEAGFTDDLLEAPETLGFLPHP